MDGALILSQTIFYFVASAAMLVVGILFVLAAYHLVRIAEELEEVARNFHDATDEAGERINDILDRLSDLPILSFLLRRSRMSSRLKRKSDREK